MCYRYESGSRGQARPVFVRAPDEVNRLVWNNGCTHNLVTYLQDKRKPAKKGAAPPRVAIVAKPCDSRALKRAARRKTKSSANTST